jgi:hypothetical protein
MGGEQPITAATIQLYAVGTSTDGGASTALINQTTTPVTSSDGTGQMNSNANAGNNYNQYSPGGFSITGDYTCPSPTSLVYIADIGGNTGAGTNNSQEGLAALGECGNLSASSFVVINEITTVGTVRALSSYMTAYDHVGSTTAHATALSTAFSLVNEYVNTSSGSAPGPSLPSGYSASDYDLRALANVVQSCVNSTGTTGVTCPPFFTDAKGSASAAPADTVTALLDIFAYPTYNVSTLFNLQGSTPAFAPVNASAPPDWTLPILELPATPTFSLAAGAYSSAQALTLSDTVNGVSIYYTTNGTTPTTSSTLYTGSIMVSSSETVEAIAVQDGRLFSSVGSAAYTITTVATPTFSVTAGDYTGTQSVSLSTATPGASIYYTINGTPTTSSTLYTGTSISVSSSETIEAIAAEGPYATSAVAIAAYSIGGVPTITSVSAVTATQTQTISITGTGFGTKAAYNGDSSYIYFNDDTTATSWQAGYTGNGTTMNITSWTDTQIVIAGFGGDYGMGVGYLSTGDTFLIGVFNAQTGTASAACTNGVVGAGATVCESQVATPSFSVGGGDYSGTQSVTLSTATPGASIYYTINGRPTTSSTPYTGAISVSSSETIEAIAVATGYANSEWGIAAYSINGVPTISKVTAVLAAKNQTFVIYGMGFGTKAAYFGDSSYIYFSDASSARSWQSGYTGNGITLDITSWTDTQIVIAGFGGVYGAQSSVQLDTGDPFVVGVFNAQTGDQSAPCSNGVVGLFDSAPTICN